MTARESLRKRAPTLAAGLVSFLVMIALVRWSGGESPLQPSDYVAVPVGAALVALLFVLNDTRGAGGRRAPELH